MSPENENMIFENPYYQGILTATIGFFILSFILLYFRKGITMQFALLLSLGGASFLCTAVRDWTYIFGLLIVYIPIWLYQLKCFTTSLARDQLDDEWKMLLSDFEAEPVDPLDFSDLDLDFYDAEMRVLEENGFYKIRDVDFTHISRAFPFIRTFYRIFGSAGHDISATVTQQKARVRLIPFFLTFKADIRCVELASEFTDGTFLSTNNIRGVNDMEIEGITFDYHPPGTSTRELLQCHRENLEAICEERNVEVRLVYTEGDMYAAARREHALIRQDRLKKGGATVEMSRREIAKASGKTSDGYYEEYLIQAQKRGEEERRKQDEGFF